MCHQFFDSSCSPRDSAQSQYGPKPGFGPYFIRALSPTEQLKSNNGRYFFITVSRVDFENAILKRQFLFSGRVLGGFWYRPPIDGPYLGFGPKFPLRNKKYGFHAKNGKRNVPCIFGFELFASRYGPPLGRADTKTRQKPALKIKIFVSKFYFQNLYAKRLQKSILHFWIRVVRLEIARG